MYGSEHYTVAGGNLNTAPPPNSSTQSQSYGSEHYAANDQLHVTTSPTSSPCQSHVYGGEQYTIAGGNLNNAPPSTNTPSHSPVYGSHYYSGQMNATPSPMNSPTQAHVYEYYGGGNLATPPSNHNHSQVHGSDQYGDVTPSPTSSVNEVAHPAHYQYQHYDMAPTPLAAVGYSSVPISPASSEVAFRNPFVYSSTYVPYENQPQAPLDPLHWELTGFTT